jgi:hypothetical protein
MRWRRILIVAIITVGLLLVVRAIVDIWADSRLNAAVWRLEKQYGSLDAASLTVSPVPEGQNRARALRAASALINYAPRASWSDYQHLFTIYMKELPPAPVPAELRSFVETNRPALRLAADARSRAESNWEADYLSNGNVPRLQEIRTLSNTIYLATVLDLEDREPDDAAQSIASGLALAASLRQEPWLIAQLIRMAVAVQHFEASQRLLVQAEPSSASLGDLARWLAENRSPDPMHVGLLAELKLFNEAFTRAASNGERPLLLGFHPPFLAGPTRWLTQPLARLTQVYYLETMGELLGLQTGARPRPPSAKPPSWWSPLKRVVNVAKPGLERAIETGDQFKSGLGLTELAVALRRFRLEHGQYPEALSGLVPTYVPSVPIDPFTGKEPVYSRVGAGFRLSAEKKNVYGSTAAVLDWNVPK